MTSTTGRGKGASTSTHKPIIPNWLITSVVLVVMVMWGTSIIYSTVNPKWPVPASVHAATVAVVTGLMGYLAVRGRGNGG